MRSFPNPFFEGNLKPISLLFLAFVLLMGCEGKDRSALTKTGPDLMQEDQRIMQLAALRIKKDSLASYLAFLQEGIRTSVAKEPGVLMLYAVQDQEDPTKITVVEIYQDQAAYEAHIASAHFLKYKNGTLSMVDSLKLSRVDPVILAKK